MPKLVHFTSQFVQTAKIHTGENTWKSFFLSGHLYIQGGNGVFIGENCLIAPGVKIISADHDVSSPERGWVQEKPIQIGSDCWIGTNAVILPGVTIGNKVIIGAGSIVTKDVPSDTIAAGNPAKVIQHTKTERNFKC